MKTKLKQIYYDMRHQPVIAWVTFVATALSVFLIMVVVMMQRVKVVPFAPESCRDRLLVGAYLHTESLEDENNSSAGLSYKSAKLLYEGLDGVEKMAYFSLWSDGSEVSAPKGEPVSVKVRSASASMFDVFDYTLVDGRYYTPEESDAMMPVAVISESTARDVFGDKPWTGRDIVLNNKLYNVVGVIKDISTLATTAHGDMFIPTGPADPNHWSEYMGLLAVAMVVADGVDFQHVRDQVKARYAELDALLKADGERTVYHESPFDQETIASGLGGSNVTPDSSSGRKMRITIYAILLLVPAINLSSMLHSRMRRRVREIGVRRAFGCSRRRVISDIISENFIVTCAGGAVGVILGVVFAATYSGLYETSEFVGRGSTPALGALLNWSTVLMALVICFILNILSASIPAWQASRMNPVDALNSK